MNEHRLSGLQVGLVVCASALVVVGLGFAGGVNQSVTTASTAPDDNRDYTLNTQGSGGLIVKRDGTLMTQGSGGGLILKRDNTLNTQGSGGLILKRDNEVGGATEDSEVPVAVAEPVAALRRGAGELAFDPSSDGFGFGNYAIGTGPDQKNVAGITTNSARAVLGDAAICKPGVEPCSPTAKAKTWIDESNKLGKYGQCFGMAAAALVGFQGGADAGFSGPAAAQTLESQPALQRSLATWQASQDTFEVERARQTVTANDAVTALTAAFKNPQAGQFMMTVANKDPNTGQRTQGHALAPYAVFSLEGSDDKYIAAYDPNTPGSAAVVHVDSAANTWTYASGSLTYDGKGDLQLVPLSALTTKPLNPDLDVDPPESVDS